jgi:hypothetical protein
MPDLTMCSAIVMESVVAESQTALASIVAAAEQAGVHCTGLLMSCLDAITMTYSAWDIQDGLRNGV